MVDDSVKGNESVSDEQIKRFIKNVGKGLACVYFTDKWAESGVKFPLAKAVICHNNGAVPFVRLQNSEDPDGSPDSSGKYAHSKIIDGKLDRQLRQYARDVKAFGSFVILEYGTEINGDWFCWSTDEGPERFKSAFRYIYKIFKEEGAMKTRFAFHVDATDNPHSTKWYPGDDVVDWIGTSCYGGYGSGKGCVDTLADCYKDFEKISSKRRLAIFEWGAPDPKNIKFNIEDTIRTLKEMPEKYPRINMLQRWSERVIAGHSSDDKIGDGRIDITSEMTEAYRKGISNPVYKSEYQ